LQISPKRRDFSKNRISMPADCRCICLRYRRIAIQYRIGGKSLRRR
jgi:hypothetical protein